MKVLKHFTLWDIFWPGVLKNFQKKKLPDFWSKYLNQLSIKNYT